MDVGFWKRSISDVPEAPFSVFIEPMQLVCVENQYSTE